MKNYQDKYDKAEYTNRPAAAKIFRKLCDYHPSFNGWEFKETKVENKDTYDFGLEKEGKKILIEHKARKYSKYTFDDWQLNGKKYDNLMTLINGNVVGVFYINTFPDGCAIGNIKKPIGERRGHTHTEKTVVDSDFVCEYDMFYKLSEASYLE